MSNYVNYHRHTQYSNIVTPDSAATNEQYLNRILELGHTVFSSNEHGYQGNYMQVHDLSKKNNLKFLFCVEAYFVKNRTGHDVTIWHLAGTGNVKYFFPNATNLVIKPNEVIEKEQVLKAQIKGV